MLGLFKKREKGLTVQDLRTAIMLCNSELLANLTKDSCPTAKKISMMKQTGFMSSTNYKELEAINEIISLKKDIEFAKTIFPKAIFIKRKDFIDLLLKYNLVCGMVKDYTGSIPDKNLAEIYETSKIIELRGIKWSINSGLIYVKEVDVHNMMRHWKIDDTLKILAFPFDDYSGIHTYRNYKPFIDMKGKKLDPEDFLIAAPANLINHKVEINRFKPKLMQSKMDDPIVFQILKGEIIMIHSMWGDEADDPMFKDKTRVL